MSFIRCICSGDTSCMAPASGSTCSASAAGAACPSARRTAAASCEVKSYSCSSFTLPARSGQHVQLHLALGHRFSVSSWRRGSPLSRASRAGSSSASRSSVRRCRAAPRRCRRRRRRGRACSSRSWRRRRSFSSISRRPCEALAVAVAEAVCIIRRSAVFRSPWYSRSSVISASMLSASSSKPTCVPSQREYVKRACHGARLPPRRARPRCRRGVP